MLMHCVFYQEPISSISIANGELQSCKQGGCILSIVLEIGKRVQEASRHLALLGSGQKNRILHAMADALLTHQNAILAANRADVEAARKNGTREAMIDRLALTPQRIAGMADGLREVAALPDPIGEGAETVKRPNGLLIGRRRVPLGVVGVIYESRPNVTADVIGLCLKSGNGVILRGGSDALTSNKTITAIMGQAAREAGCPADAFLLVEDASRESAAELMRLSGYVDVLIPRGGAGLIRSVIENATVPVIETGTGVCHTYIDEGCDADMAVSIAVNAKAQRPSVCNAMETMLVHEGELALLKRLLQALRDAGVAIRGCARTLEAAPWASPAAEEDWAAEYNDYILSVKVVRDIDEAMDHIRRYGTRHSEAIVTQDYARAQRFLNEVDAAAVYVNASTRFTDGNQFGLGAEIGISNQKLHVRGPMGVRELTTLKYIIYGNGQIRE